MSTPEAPDAAATQVAARLTATAEDREKPRFVGVLNGIEFIAEGAPAPPVGACTRDTLRELSPLEAPGAIKMSRLNFEAAHLPGGFVLGPEIASLCEGEIVVTGRAYANDDGLPLSITRIAGPPVFDAVAPEVRMEPGAFGGRPGVLVHPITPEHVALVFMYDGETSWIVATPAGVDELVSVAEAVRPVPGLGELGK